MLTLSHTSGGSVPNLLKITNVNRAALLPAEEQEFCTKESECKINEGELWLLVNVKISLMLLFSHLYGPEFIS